MNLSSRHRYCPFDATPLDPPPEAGEKAGGRCPRCGYVDYRNPRPAVGCFIYNGRQVLLCQPVDKPDQSAWDLIGGFVESEPAETDAEAVQREVTEETTLHVELIDLEHLGSLPDVYRGRDNRDYPTLNYIYLVRQWSGKPKPGDDVAKLDWFDLDKLPDLAFPHQVRAVQLLRRHLGLTDR